MYLKVGKIILTDLDEDQLNLVVQTEIQWTKLGLLRTKIIFHANIVLDKV